MRHRTLLILLCLAEVLIDSLPVAVSAPKPAPLINQASATRQAPRSTDDDADDRLPSKDSRDNAAFQRSLLLLRKQPRPGAALDRVLQYHEERDSLTQFLNELRTTPPQSGDTSTAAIRGMAEAFRGNYPEARSAFVLAETQRPNDPVISWLLGQTCLNLRDPASAADALQRALAKKPASSDLLQIGKDLSLALRQSGKADQIIGMWMSIEALSGNSERIAEQIAVMLRSDGQLPEAIQRFEALSRNHSDPWKATQFAITAADLKLQLGQSDAALSDLKTTLAGLSADSAQAQQIRSRIEDLFRRSGDLAGLSAWYQTHLAEFPDDTAAVLRFLDLLVRRSQSEDADRLLRDALRQSPSSLTLRRALIQRQRAQKRFDEALTLYQQLEQDQLAEAEDLEAWGQLCLQVSDQPVEQRQAAASQVWRKLLTGHENDPAQLRRAASLLQTVAPPTEVISLYESAIGLDPGNSSSRELLGEFLLSRGRLSEALTAWRSVAEGSRRSEETLRELSEILARHGQAKEAIETLQAACGDSPDFDDVLILSRMMREYQEGATWPFTAEALQLLTRAENLCETAEDQQRVLQEKVLTLQKFGELSNRIQILQQSLSGEAGSAPNSTEQPPAERWLELATLCLAAERNADAIAAVTEAVRIAPDSVPALRLAADLYQKNGRLADAARLKQILLERDPRSRVLYLRSLAELELQLGNREGAVNAATALATAAENSVESSAFSAEILMQAGQSRDALRILKRMVAANPDDADASMEFVAALIDTRQTDEAEDLCWQLLERTQDDELRLRVIPTLAELSRQAGRSQELMARLESLLASEDNSAILQRCLSAAWQSLGNSAAARAAMEQLAASPEALPEDKLRLAELCLAENDAPAALQNLSSLNLEQLSLPTRNRAEELLLNAAVASNATEQLAGLVSSRWTITESLQKIDQLLAEGASDAAATLSRELAQKHPESRPTRIRLAVSQWLHGNQQQAVPDFRRFLDAEPTGRTTHAETLQASPTIPPKDTAETLNTAPNSVHRNAPHSTEIFDIRYWQQLYENSDRILLASGRMSVLDLQSVLDSPSGATALSLMALAKHASQRGQLSALFDELQQAADNPAAASHLWMLRRLWGAGQGASWNSAEDSIRLLQHGHPLSAIAVLSDIDFLYGMQRSPQSGDNNRPAKTSDNPGIPHSPQSLNDGDLLLILQAFVEGSADLSATQLSNISAAIAQAIHMGTPERRTAAETFLKVHWQQASPYERLLSQRLAADLAATWGGKGPTISELLTILKPPVPPHSEVTNREREWTEAMVTLVTEQLSANSSRPSAEDLMVVLEWWVQLRAVVLAPSQTKELSENLSFTAFRPETFRNSMRISPLLSEFLTQADQRLLDQLLISGAHLAPQIGPRNAPWKAAIPNRPAAEHVPATLAWLVPAILSGADTRQVHADVADLLVRFAPESLTSKIWQITHQESAGQYARALEILDSLPDNDPALLSARELKALQLSAFSGEHQRALLAASRLSGMQLSVTQQLELLRGMRLAGLHKEYTNAVSRLYPPDHSITPQRQLEYLNLLLARGQQTEAIQLATDILNRPTMNSGARFRRTAKITSDDLRKRAAEVLTLFPTAPAISPPKTSDTSTERPASEASPNAAGSTKPNAGLEMVTSQPAIVSSDSGVIGTTGPVTGPTTNSASPRGSAVRPQRPDSPTENRDVRIAATVPESPSITAARTWIENWRAMRARVEELQSTPEIILPVLKRLSAAERNSPEFLPLWIDCAIPRDAPATGKSLCYQFTVGAEPIAEADDLPAVLIWRILLQQTPKSLAESQLLQKIEDGLQQFPTWSDGHVFRACLLAREHRKDQFQNAMAALNAPAGTPATAAALALLAETVPESIQTQRQCLQLLHVALTREQPTGWLFGSPMSAAWRKLCLQCNEPHRVAEIAASRWQSRQTPPVATVRFQIQAALWLLEQSCPLDALRIFSLLQEQDVVRYHTSRVPSLPGDAEPTISLSSLQLQAAQSITVDMLMREMQPPGSADAASSRRSPILLKVTASGNSAVAGSGESLPECLILHQIAEMARVSPAADLTDFADAWNRLLEVPDADELVVGAGSMVLLTRGEAPVRDAAADALLNWLSRREAAEFAAAAGREDLAAIALSAAWALDHRRNSPPSEAFLQWALRHARFARMPELESALVSRMRRRLLDSTNRAATEKLLADELESILQAPPQP